MTKNKRYSFNWERGHPQFWDNYCDLADCYLTCEDVCELLNELNDKKQAVKDILNELNEIDEFWDSALLQDYITKIANVVGVELDD